MPATTAATFPSKKAPGVYRGREAGFVSDVVTGKLDVRGVAVPEYEAVEDVGDGDSESLDEESTEDGEE